MDAQAALGRLQDISSQLRSAVIFERGGKVLGSTLAEEERAEQVATEAAALLAEAESRRREEGSGEFAQLEVALRGGSVFVVSHGELLIAATTPPEPTVGLVFYDLKSCLRELEAAEPKRKPRAAERQKPAARKPAASEKKTDAKP
ncbi:MAG TPA: roadblock/LC7 domain-containing protein [Gaiellaceae bacterium]